MALSEDEIIAAYFAPLAGPGAFGLTDDAAEIAPPPGDAFVVTKDVIVAGGHFFSDDPPADIARKLLRVNLSDLAAKGARPFGCFLGLVMPEGLSEHWLPEFASGLGQDIRDFGFPLLGGDTAKGPLTLSLTALGTVPVGGMVRRGGARAGDILYVTGTIGDAVLGLKIRLGQPQDRGWIAALPHEARDFLLRRYLVPEPRVALAQALQRHAHGAMDISDGFVGDARKMLKVSAVGAVLRLSDVPLSVAARLALAHSPHLFDDMVTGGDDYELLVAVPPEQSSEFERAARASGVALSAVGLCGGAAAVFRGPDGEARHFAKGSYAHF